MNGYISADALYVTIGDGAHMKVVYRDRRGQMVISPHASDEHIRFAVTHLAQIVWPPPRIVHARPIGTFGPTADGE